MIKQELCNLIDQIFYQLKKDGTIPTDTKLPKYTLEIPPLNIPADLASNLVLLLAQSMNKHPAEIAKKIIPLFALCSSLIAKVEFSPPGFLNFTLAETRLYDELKKIVTEKEAYAKINLGKREKVLFEFVSANPTGPLHVGHGRGAAVGDSLARIFEFLGWQVTREYYVNDVGNQIDNLAGSVMLKCEELKNGYLTADEKEWLLTQNKENFYRGEYITQIAEDVVKQFSQVKFRESGHKFFAKQATEKILTWIKNDLKDFNVKFDSWVYESTLYENKEVEQTLTILRSKGFAYEKDNALWLKSTVYGDEKDRVLVRANEQPTYFASDIAYHQNKFQRKFNKLFDLWGADHHGYVARMKAAVDALSYNRDDLKIILYQLVSLIREGKPVTMSTRAGEFISLRELLNEVGKDACRYFFLTRSPEAQLQFDLDLAKKQSPENPVYYIQYAHTRIASIFREAKKAGIRYQARGTRHEALKEQAELNLIKKLCFFSDTLVSCVEDLTPHYLPTYLLDLANEFHRYYEKYRVITADKDLTLARLTLVDAIGTVIRTGLDLIGVSAPETM